MESLTDETPSDQNDAKVERDKVAIPARPIGFLEEDELSGMPGCERK